MLVTARAESESENVSWVNMTKTLHCENNLKGRLCSFRFCIYLADPATFLASNSVLGTLFSTENSLFIQLWKKIHISEFVL